MTVHDTTSTRIAGIPIGPLFLGLAGLIPFLWGAATLLWPELQPWAVSRLGSRFVGPYVQIFYGTIILAFMSGVLWGFSTKSDGWTGYAFSVIPALWAFFMVGGGPVSSATNLAVGFAGLLLLDWYFAMNGLAPDWWMKLRSLLTLIVLLTLVPIIF